MASQVREADIWDAGVHCGVGTLGRCYGKCLTQDSAPVEGKKSLVQLVRNQNNSQVLCTSALVFVGSLM